MDIVASGKTFVSIRDGFKILLTFILAVFAWVLFRSDSMNEAFTIYKNVFSFSFFKSPQNVPYLTLVLLAAFIMAEWFGRTKDHPLQLLEHTKSPVLRWTVYYAVIFVIICFGVFQQSQFIYFQF